MLWNLRMKFKNRLLVNSAFLFLGLFFFSFFLYTPPPWIFGLFLSSVLLNTYNHHLIGPHWNVNFLLYLLKIWKSDLCSMMQEGNDSSMQIHCWKSHLSSLTFNLTPNHQLRQGTSPSPLLPMSTWVMSGILYHSCMIFSLSKTTDCY